MSVRVRQVCAGGAVLLGVLLLVLLGSGPRFTADGDDDDDGTVRVRCGSVLAVGWPTDGSTLDDETSRSYGDHLVSGEAGFVAREGIARDCSERRDTYLGLSVLLVVPTTLLGAAALLGGRRGVPAPPPPAGPAPR